MKFVGILPEKWSQPVENLNLMRMENIKEIERGREWRLEFSCGSAT
jgi:hypothetical protein